MATAENIQNLEKEGRLASLLSKCRLEVVFSCWLFNQSFIVLPAAEYQ